MGVLVFCPYKEIYLGQNFLIRQNIFCRRPSKLGGPEKQIFNLLRTNSGDYTSCTAGPLGYSAAAAVALSLLVRGSREGQRKMLATCVFPKLLEEQTCKIVP